MSNSTNFGTSLDGTPSVTWTIPLQVSISLLAPISSNPSQVTVTPSDTLPDKALLERPMQVPVMYGDLHSRTGYQPGFLDLDDGSHVPLPSLTAGGQEIAAQLEDGSSELKYQHFSIVMHKKRRMALFTASNVDWSSAMRTVNGRKPSRKELTGIPEGMAEEWVTDPRIPDDHQLPDIFYTKDGGSFDKGHLIRREDVCWGASFTDMQTGNGDTYHTTNCSPQTAAFNQGSRGEDNWGDLESLIQKEAKSERIVIFAGPIFADNDPVFEGRGRRGPLQIQIPKRYWKIVVAKGTAGPEVFGFVLTQNLSSIEFTVPMPWTRRMEPVASIEQSLQGLLSLEWLKLRDQYDTLQGQRIQESLLNV